MKIGQSAIVVILVSLGMQVRAEVTRRATTKPISGLMDVAALLEKSRNLAEFEKLIEGRVDPKVIKFVREKSKQGMSVPLKVVRRNDHAISLQAGGQFVSIESKEELDENWMPHFLINGTEVFVLPTDEPAVLYDKIERALPKMTGSILDLAVPSAQAVDLDGAKAAVTGAATYSMNAVADGKICAAYQTVMEGCNDPTLTVTIPGQLGKPDGQTKLDNAPMIAKVAHYLATWEASKGGRELVCNDQANKLKTCFDRALTKYNKDQPLTARTCGWLHIKRPKNPSKDDRCSMKDPGPGNPTDPGTKAGR